MLQMISTYKFHTFRGKKRAHSLCRSNPGGRWLGGCNAPLPLDGKCGIFFIPGFASFFFTPGFASIFLSYKFKDCLNAPIPISHSQSERLL